VYLLVVCVSLFVKTVGLVDASPLAHNDTNKKEGTPTFWLAPPVAGNGELLFVVRVGIEHVPQALTPRCEGLDLFLKLADDHVTHFDLSVTYFNQGLEYGWVIASSF
jgi:hypothetical protein